MKFLDLWRIRLVQHYDIPLISWTCNSYVMERKNCVQVTLLPHDMIIWKETNVAIYVDIWWSSTATKSDSNFGLTKYINVQRITRIKSIRVSECDSTTSWDRISKLKNVHQKPDLKGSLWKCIFWWPPTQYMWLVMAEIKIHVTYHMTQAKHHSIFLVY